MRWVLKTPVFKFLASLKLAVLTLLSLSAVLGTATVLESVYGTRAVYFMVYGTLWFYGLLGFLGMNVLCAALSRYPWKRSKIGFLVTHSGILTILVGSFLTAQFGVDGSLPIVQGQAENKVVLNGLVLSVQDEKSGLNKTLDIVESGLERSGNLMKLAFPSGESLELRRYLPRVTLENKMRASPVEGKGSPAVKVGIANSRFSIEEWILDLNPGEGQSLNLGPAVIVLKKLWSEKEEADFFQTKRAEEKSRLGYLVFDVGTRNFRLPIESAIKKWKPLGGDLEVFVEKYLPYAVVQKGELVSKSNEPVNPAVQLLIRNNRGQEEKHSVFAAFPEFSTMHKNHSKGKALGVNIRMIASTTDEDPKGRGRLELAQSPDNKRLLYRVFSRAGETNTKGVVKVGEEVPTGWMDLKFKVTEWIPFAVEETVPHYVEKISGSDSNFLTSLYFEKGNDGFWLTEGGSRVVDLKDASVSLGLSRRVLPLPFEIFLKKFTVGNDPGTNKAASYESRVRVRSEKGEGEEVLISMNEPLTYGGYTFYQASYQLREGQPPVSVLSVNFDPGRMVKYGGSLMMVLGILLMFYLNPHYWDIILGRKVS